MTSKAVKTGLIAAVLALGAYWYYSPYLAMRAMQAAAQKNDADTVNEHVDYPKLRESLKGQMAAMMTERLGKASSTGAEALGAALGMAMVHQFVEAFVRPEAVMQAMKSGKLEPKTSEGSPAQDGNAKRPDWAVERKSTDKVIAYARDPEASDSARAVGLVFERYGFATWKLTEIRMPSQSE